jgi:SulP family sulfate permease
MTLILKKSGDFFGAFADAAILLPIISLMALKSGYRLDSLLLSAGLAYLVSGFLFKIPISVQPLKSIAIASLAMGASFQEIRISGLCVGLFFLVLYALKTQTLPIPEAVIRSVQCGLGILLAQQAIKILPLEWSSILFTLGLVGALIMSDLKLSIPLLGMVSFVVFIFGTLHSGASASSGMPTPTPHALRLSLILSLVLPQLALTSANSILGAKLACDHYFKEKARNVTIPKLLLSISIGNILSSMIAGLPYCHGAGGITAHYKAGARTGNMNTVIGLVLCLMGLLQFFFHFPLSLPPLPTAAILISVGVFHFELAKPLLRNRSGQITLLGSSLATLLTANLLATFVVAWALDFILKKQKDFLNAKPL